ncbi:hypothetical protein C3747_42g6 [Trypanosoma cruzi]|uniref:Uncharacterized protein n=2 Tax=Trypanosoma cruzi TaxID=5693 RepID=Q4DJE4_TRYCC|nr:hypothetical protein, conserved [Trypanosoma cruzi]EAN92657.1 hypothetical protein, conserved [Trypanosoma cruzi]PWV13532.1 hypothetical protein C3747_42g6 [Trypanosoma cruzi]RNC42298.1 hypothetical protein TcCL_NonESM08104 [Trypanosoma cruzi]|eukprot:XP_814508.1 hypothetical protein [Trypanosoma cruzi strain CL Brener]
MSKTQNGVGNDPQLQAVNAFTEAQSLLDIMLKNFYSVERQAADPFLLRVVIAGKKKESAGRSVGSLLPELLNVAVNTSENPLCEDNEKSAKNFAVLVEYDDYFIELIEGFERHIINFLKLLEKHCSQKEDIICYDVRLLYLVDDVPSPIASFFVHIDKVPAMSTEGEPQDSTDEEIADTIAEDVNNLMKLLNMVADEPSTKRKLFLDNLRVTHPLLFPRKSMIKKYLESDIFFTLSEYIDVYGKISGFTRDIELNHPVVDSLKC